MAKNLILDVILLLQIGGGTSISSKTIINCYKHGSLYPTIEYAEIDEIPLAQWLRPNEENFQEDSLSLFD